jgi:hypothetical protein
MKRFFGFILTVGLTACGILQAETPASGAAIALGEKEAKNDLGQGKLAVESYGKPVIFRETYQKLLKQRYGIEVRTVAGCAVDDQIAGHAEGYNKAMNAEIQKRFGADVFERTLKEAGEIHRKSGS